MGAHAGDELADGLASADRPVCPACGGACTPYARRAARCGACGTEAFTGPLSAAAEWTREEVDRYSRVVYEQQADALAEDHRARLARIARLLPPGRLLDAGCGGGAFLDLARAAGWRAEGCDPSASPIELARRKGHTVYQASLEDLPGPGEYDLVTIWCVLAHVERPLDLLRAAVGQLRPGGLVVLYTPNGDSALARAGRLGRLLGRTPPGLSRFHRWRFGRRGLRALFARAGLEVVGIGADDSSGSSAVRRVWRRREARILVPVLRAAYRAAVAGGQSPHLFAAARRPG